MFPPREAEKSSCAERTRFRVEKSRGAGTLSAGVLPYCMFLHRLSGSWAKGNVSHILWIPHDPVWEGGRGLGWSNDDF